MPKTFQLCIVIPCYNEEKRLDPERVLQFLEPEEHILLCFVNDGSSDATLSLLNKFKSKFPKNISVVSLEKNSGKAEAVRAGILDCHSNHHFEKIAYLDADLSTSLEECYAISKLVQGEILFAFGSRLAILGSVIKRKYHRFLIGRLIATLISRQLKLEVYDTQCGCKVFDQSLSKMVFKEQFISKWLFDVEIFHRISIIHGRSNMNGISIEVPLKSWIDTNDSKVKLLYFFKLWLDLFNIKRKYKSAPLKSN